MEFPETVPQKNHGSGSKRSRGSGENQPQTSPKPSVALGYGSVSNGAEAATRLAAGPLNAAGAFIDGGNRLRVVVPPAGFWSLTTFRRRCGASSRHLRDPEAASVYFLYEHEQNPQ